ncbi:CerR family C-terminal domain-containing protein [Tropicimonas sp. IMCC6043]|uniref:CerR family C-terminal domain-containing protein n=1 Tax=Tropicimonas sp. IMCC6043 TaxID=2510645 RepID=UPI00101D6C84|nr:CerR family C-terminal domain-containing protein [Tropicimonas sp. IMCC6043]RYH11818.1 DUF1956 domain-containing protein [Tropicimonas sp. IMCC6043]
MSEAPPPQGPSEQTRRALIDAAITLFGKAGYQASSTRAIAQRAGTNVASIAYHFGGKAALRLACAEAVAERIGAVLGATEIPSPTDPDHAVQILAGVVRNFVHFILLEQEEANFVPFMLRELAEEGPALDLVYSTTFAPRHRAFCRLWEAASGWPAESEETRLAVFAIIGQVLYFRIGESLVKRRLDWDRLDEARVAKVTDIITTHLKAAISAAREITHD